MTVQQIYDYVERRVGKIADAEFLAELNRAYALFWYQVDPRDSVMEVDLAASAERQIILPWFIHEVKGVRDIYDQPAKLMTPRPYYNQNAAPQSDYEWRIMHRTPLFKLLEVAGRIVIKPRRKLTSPVTVTITGPGDFGVTEIEALTLAAGATSIETTAVFHNVTSLSKSAVTTADIVLYDVKENEVAILPASYSDVWCQLVQLTDARHRKILSTGDSVYTVLYKQVPPVLSTFTEAVPTEYGLVLQDTIVESFLGSAKDQDTRAQAQTFGGKAAATLNGVQAKHAEPHVTKINAGTSPYFRTRCGYL